MLTENENMAGDGSEFNLLKVEKAFAESRNGNGEILLDQYVIAYTELCRFLNLLGTVFHFVLTDVKDKLGILQQHRTSEYGMNYITIHSMVNYEVGRKITIGKRKPASGCRTLLRLHRAMEFIMTFLHDIGHVDQDEKLSVTAFNAYNATLSKHHTWIVRKAVGLAMYALPTREHLLRELNCDSEETGKQNIDKLVQECRLIYDNVQQLYCDNDLLTLP